MQNLSVIKRGHNLAHGVDPLFCLQIIDSAQTLAPLAGFDNGGSFEGVPGGSFEGVPGCRSQAKLLSKDEARRIAMKIAKLPDLLWKP